MGSYAFNGTTNRFRSDATYLAGLGTAFSLACLVNTTAYPAGGFFADPFSLTGTAARQAALEFSSTSITLAVGSTSVAPSSNILPATGRWAILCATKAAGTVAPAFYSYDHVTDAWTNPAAGSTIADRTAGAINVGVGAFGATDFYTGRIAACGAWNRVLNAGEVQSLADGRFAWMSLFGRGVITRDTEVFIDLTQPGTYRDQMNPSQTHNTGTLPAFDAVDTPPRW